jgi:hypothetical protein
MVEQPLAEAVRAIQKDPVIPSSRVGYIAMTAARFFLGLAMLPYAIDKLLAYQFKLPAWSYAQPLGSTSGSTLAWAMFGYSPHLQMLLGFFELVPALLLLNVRTRRLGALIMLPVLLNVALINVFLDLWRNTTIVSFTLLLVNVFLILYDRSVYLDLFKRILVSPTGIANSSHRLSAKIATITIVIVGISLSVLAIAFSMVHFQIPVADFTGMPQINGSGTWKIESLTIGGKSTNPDPDASFYFNLFNTCEYGTPAHPSFGTFKADKSRHTFQIRQVLFEGSASTVEGTYQLQGDRLLLNGTRDNQALSLTLERAYRYTGW